MPVFALHLRLFMESFEIITSRLAKIARSCSDMRDKNLSVCFHRLIFSQKTQTVDCQWTGYSLLWSLISWNFSPPPTIRHKRVKNFLFTTELPRLFCICAEICRRTIVKFFTFVVKYRCRLVSLVKKGCGAKVHLNT